MQRLRRPSTGATTCRLLLVVLLGGCGASSTGAAEAETSVRAAPSVQRDPLPEGAVMRFGTTRLRQCDRVTAVAVPPDGRWVAAADRAGCVRAWSVEDGARIAHLRIEGDGGVIALAASADGRRIAASASDGVVVLEADGGRVVSRGRPFEGVAGELRFVLRGEALVAVDREGERVAVLDVTPGGLTERWTRRLAGLAHVHVSPDSRRLIGVAGGEVKVLAASDGEEQASFGIDSGDPRVARFGPTGERYAIASDRAVHLLDASGEENGRINIAFSAGSEGAVRDLAFVDDETLVVLPDDGTMRLVDVHGNERRRFNLGLAADAVRVSPAARLAVMAGPGRQPRLFDLSSGGSPLRFEAHDGPVRSLAVSPDGEALATAGDDGMVRLWSIREGRPLLSLDAERSLDSVAFLGPDHIAGGDRAGELTLWRSDGTTLQHVSTANAGDAEHAVRSLTASADGSLLVSTNTDHLQFWRHAPDRATPLVEELGFDVSECTLVALSPDGRTVAASADGDRLVRYRPSSEGERGSMGPWVEEQWGAHEGSLRGIAWAPDGERIATVDETGRIHIWAADGETVAEMRADSALSAVAWSPSGDLLAVGRRDGAVAIWPTHGDASEPLAELEGHEGAVAGLAFSPDGRLVFSASEDETALGWDVASLPRTGQGPRP